MVFLLHLLLLAHVSFVEIWGVAWADLEKHQEKSKTSALIVVKMVGCFQFNKKGIERVRSKEGMCESFQENL